VTLATRGGATEIQGRQGGWILELYLLKGELFHGEGWEGRRIMEIKRGGTVSKGESGDACSLVYRRIIPYATEVKLGVKAAGGEKG